MRLNPVSVAAATTVVAIAEAKLHLRVDYNDEDSLIGNLLTSALDWVEEWCGQDFREKTWRLDLPKEFTRLTFPRGRVKSVQSVGAQKSPWGVPVIALLIPDNYRLIPETKHSPAMLEIKDGYVWDQYEPAENAIQVHFTTGWDVIPGPVKSAVLLHASTQFHHREDQAEKGSSPVQLGIERLLAPYRMIKT
jgi:uncharacterized phiE125 gp8 family phage protein